jgi:DNA-binding MarR family transcriptional regulator
MAMKAKPNSSRENEIWTLLNQAQHAAERAAETEMRQLGIPKMHAEVLSLIKNTEGPVTPADIARLLFREPHTISGLLNRMEKQGLVKRVKDLKRKNLVRVAITDKGERSHRKMSGAEVIHDVMSGLTAKEQDELKRYLEKIRRKALDELRKRQPFPYA